MPNQEFNDEEFQNLGGINAKASPYIVGAQQFTDLLNFDFQTPGALTKRWGSTQYFTQSYTGQIQSLYEFTRLSGSSYIVFSASGGLFYGGTQGQFQGVSLPNYYQSISLQACVYCMGTQNVGFVLHFWGTPTDLYTPDGATVFSLALNQNNFYLNFSSAQTYQNQFSYAVLNNTLYFADGSKFMRFDGTNVSKYLLPPVTAIGFSGSAIFPGAVGTTLPRLPLTNSYMLYAAFLGYNSQLGPVWPICKVPVGASNLNYTLIGGSFFNVQIAVNIPQNFGITSVITFASALPLINPVLQLGSGISTAITFADWSRNVKQLGSTPVTPGATQMTVTWGILNTSSVDLDEIYNNIPDTLPAEFQSQFGLTYGIGLSSYPFFNIDEGYLAPKYLEVFSNQLMQANLPSAKSSVLISNIADADITDIENEIEVRTNDGDEIRAHKTFGSGYFVFKEFSYHEISGSDPSNVVLTQRSDQYGCLNNRCVVTYDNVMLFLDRKGVIEFNGSGQELISYVMQPYFDRMNVTVAKQTACMAHDKQRNQVLIAIPLDSSTVNNITIVYDYIVRGWTKYAGFNPSLFVTMRGVLPNKTTFYGGYSGNIFNFGASFYGDNGVGFTVYFKTHYNHSLGNSIEKQYRRIWVNTEPNPGSSQVLSLNVYPNIGASGSFSGTMPINPFQSKVDFGVSAKSVAFDLANFNSTESIRIHGYVLSYRYQRAK